MWTQKDIDIVHIVDTKRINIVKNTKNRVKMGYFWVKISKLKNPTPIDKKKIFIK